MVVALRQRKGRTLTFVTRNEGDGVAIAKRVVDRLAIVHADEASHWDALHAGWKTLRIKPWELADADYPNPFLAVRAACAIVDHPFHKRSWDDRRRVYCSYVGFEFPTVEPIIDEARHNNGTISTTWPVADLNPQEEATLNLLVNDYQIYAYLKQPEQWEMR